MARGKIVPTRAELQKRIRELEAELSNFKRAANNALSAITRYGSRTSIDLPASLNALFELKARVAKLEKALRDLLHHVETDTGESDDWPNPALLRKTRIILEDEVRP